MGESADPAALSILLILGKCLGCDLISHGGAHSLPLPLLSGLCFCTRKAQVTWRGRKPFHLSPHGGWEGAEDPTMYCRVYAWGELCGCTEYPTLTYAPPPMNIFSDSSRSPL